MKRSLPPAFIRASMLVLIGLLSVSVLYVAAQVAPSWWQQRGALDPTQTADDYAAANQGQVKNLTRAAVEEMNALLPDGAGTELNALVHAWTDDPSAADDYAVINLGQLKALTAPLYARLEIFRQSLSDPTWATLTAPWVESGATEEDHAVANIGQVKHAFAALEGNRAGLSSYDPSAQKVFGLGWLRDSDADGQADYLEVEGGNNWMIYDSWINSPQAWLATGLRVTTPFE